MPVRALPVFGRITGPLDKGNSLYNNLGESQWQQRR